MYSFKYTSIFDFLVAPLLVNAIVLDGRLHNVHRVRLVSVAVHHRHAQLSRAGRILVAETFREQWLFKQFGQVVTLLAQLVFTAIPFAAVIRIVQFRFTKVAHVVDQNIHFLCGLFQPTDFGGAATRLQVQNVHLTCQIDTSLDGLQVSFGHREQGDIVC